MPETLHLTLLRREAALLNHSFNSNKFLCAEDLERKTAMQYLVSGEILYTVIHLITVSDNDSSTSVKAILYRAADHIFVFVHGLGICSVLHVSTYILNLKRQMIERLFPGCLRYSRPSS